jgi:MFS family permease
MLQGNLAAATGFGSFIAFVFLTTLLMQQQLHYSPTKTGLSWLYTTGTAFVVAGLTGTVLAQRFGARPLLTVASVSMLASAGWLIYLPRDPHFAISVLPALVGAGVAVGLFAPSVQIAALADVGEADFGAASGLIETSREFGASIVIASASTVLLGAHADFLHGLHRGYGVIAIAAALGIVVTAARFRAPASPLAEPELSALQ